ncbi:hypothetical protein EVAR_57717_1 [Eumeta japonica]|uniref:Uncharacterized protein n=1 Tax=Eumeta variegata TaxID=151549 RepID=A0A4C1Y7M0_EUMVA|nr:hypothetical protein EVAR_57717_1 [Eumeta japonica]
MRLSHHARLCNVHSGKVALSRLRSERDVVNASLLHSLGERYLRGHDASVAFSIDINTVCAVPIHFIYYTSKKCITHTCTPVRAGSVGLKPIQNVALKFGIIWSAMLYSWTSIIASPNAVRRRTGVSTARDTPYGRFLKGSPRHKSLDTDTGRVHFSYPARKRPGGMREL